MAPSNPSLVGFRSPGWRSSTYVCAAAAAATTFVGCLIIISEQVPSGLLRAYPAISAAIAAGVAGFAALLTLGLSVRGTSKIRRVFVWLLASVLVVALVWSLVATNVQAALMATPISSSREDSVARLLLMAVCAIAAAFAAAFAALAARRGPSWRALRSPAVSLHGLSWVIYGVGFNRPSVFVDDQIDSKFIAVSACGVPNTPYYDRWVPMVIGGLAMLTVSLLCQPARSREMGPRPPSRRTGTSRFCIGALVVAGWATLVSSGSRAPRSTYIPQHCGAQSWSPTLPSGSDFARPVPLAQPGMIFYPEPRSTLTPTYPNGSITDRSGLPVTSISGSNDRLATPAKIDAAKPKLPSDTGDLAIAGDCGGGIHSLFGDYGLPNRRRHTVNTREEVPKQIQAASLDLLRRVETASA